MTSFKSYSQCSQDRFVRALIADKPHPYFIDVGASHPTELSNTYGLNMVGWIGCCLEIEHELCELLRNVRGDVLAPGSSLIIEGDAIKNASMINALGEHVIGKYIVDYLSVDIDEATLEFLRKLDFDKVAFRVITIEHDAYRFGDRLRLPEREILTAAGYVLIAPDVANADTPHMPFEDWWVAPELADKAKEILASL